MKLWTFYKERVDGYMLPRWTWRCNEADKSGVTMLATLGPISLEACKYIAKKSGWSEDQPTQILKGTRTDKSVIDHIKSQLDGLEIGIKTPPKAGIQFS